MLGKAAKVQFVGFCVELFGAGMVALGVFSIPFRLFVNTLVGELLVALGMLILLIGRFFR